ncbi:hypothetical protein I302_100317 [Kwoniella bestiolae CBS 10118]|uniref:Uncharacterized protein n=1 Tax=Kwoniella bestiolae CBS 10118 TaxID=1296100 RepID=A0A1B9G4S5_9TREE|nr:hypothetical protein I302_03689 [Kwoniella bestiolae CBS 10118]OCF26012.1 hypothetical protein I302_03689 [Kwoniella bestiolae CBS 10118]
MSTTTTRNQIQTHTQTFPLSLTSSHFPPFTIVPSPTKSTPTPLRSPITPPDPIIPHINFSRHHEDEGRNMSLDRDSLSIDTFASVIQRDTVYSRASNVAIILRSLGPSASDREQGISALCGYIEGKKARGKNDEEVRKKLGVLEGMVPADLGDVFEKASLRSGLARKTTHPHPPIPLCPIHRSRLSLASLSSGTSSSPTPSPTPPIHETTRPDTSPITYTSPSPSFTFSFSPVSSSNSTSSSSLNFEYDSSASSSFTPSSFSSPPPLTSSTPPYTSLPLTPGSPSQSVHPHRSARESTPESFIAFGRAPTLLSPLAIGGWGRSWERPLLNNRSGTGSSSTLVFDGISLESFPTPPDHIPSPSSPFSEDSSQDKAVGSLDLKVCIETGNAGLSPTKSTSRTMDQSWLSLSISDDSSSSGLPSASLPSISEAFEWDEMVRDQLGVGMGLEMGDERTVTGIESSRWSAVVSGADETSSNDRSGLRDGHGPTEASLLRDAYLSMIHTINVPGPEQGDSHTILMAYAQAAAA